MSDTPRKIIQLLRDKTTLHALCDDGTIWRLDEWGIDRGAYFDVQDRAWVPSGIPAISREATA